MHSFLRGLAMCLFCLVLDIRWNRRIVAEGSKVLCGFPGTPAGGSIQPRMDSYPLGTKINFLCNDGYEHIGPKTTSCNNQGVWSNFLPLCVQNLAYKRPAYQSSTENSFSADLAIDGLDVTCAETKVNHNNMWWVVLPKTYTFSKIKFKLTVAYPNAAVNISIDILESNFSNRSSRCKIYSNVGKTVYEEEITCGNQQLNGSVIRFQDLRNRGKLRLCEVKAYDNSEYDCGEPDWQPNCEVELTTKGKSRYAEYKAKKGFQLVKGDILRPCVRGKWSGTSPLCLSQTFMDITANTSESTEEKTNTSDNKDNMIIGIAIGVTAASISTIIVIVVIVVIMRKFYRKAPSQSGTISSQHEGIFLHANHSSCGSGSPTIQTTYSDPWDDPSKHTYDYINSETLCSDRLKREASLKSKPHIDGTGYIMSARRKGSHEADNTVRESLLYPPVPVKPRHLERRPELIELHIPNEDNRTNSFNEIEVDAYDYSGTDDHSHM